MVRFDFRQDSIQIVEDKYQKYLNDLYFNPNISEEFSATLIHLNGLIKLISLCGAKVYNVDVTEGNMTMIAGFKRNSINSKIADSPRPTSIMFDVTHCALETNIHKCMAERKSIFNELGKVYDGTGKFFNNTAKAINLVNSYFKSMVEDKTLYTIEEFATANFGENWQNDRRAYAYTKVLEAACGVSAHGEINNNINAIYQSLVEVMQLDKEFQASTAPNTPYVEQKVDTISLVQSMMVETAKSINPGPVQSAYDARPLLSTYEESNTLDQDLNDSKCVELMLRLTADEISEGSFVNDAINCPRGDSIDPIDD